GVTRLIVNPSVFVASCFPFQPRPLPSTGVTRLQQYCEPLRHPIRPGLALASCQLIPTLITAGASRVAPDPLCLHAVGRDRGRRGAMDDGRPRNHPRRKRGDEGKGSSLQLWLTLPKEQRWTTP